MWLHVFSFYIFIAFCCEAAINSSVCDDEKIRLAIQTCIADVKSCVNKTLFVNPIAITTTAETKPGIKAAIFTTDAAKSTTTATSPSTTLTGIKVINFNELKKTIVLK